MSVQRTVTRADVLHNGVCSKMIRFSFRENTRSLCLHQTCKITLVIICVQWFVGALCVFAASTQIHTELWLGLQSCRVINNWPFVPFLPCLFLFPTSADALSVIEPSLVVSFFLCLPPALLFFSHVPLCFFAHCVVFFAPLALHVFISFFRLPLLPFSYLWHTLCPPLSIYFSLSQVIVETLCPTFTKTAPLPAIPQRLICVGVHVSVIVREQAANNRYCCCLCFCKTFFCVKDSLTVAPTEPWCQVALLFGDSERFQIALVVLCAAMCQYELQIIKITLLLSSKSKMCKSLPSSIYFTLIANTKLLHFGT